MQRRRLKLAHLTIPPAVCPLYGAAAYDCRHGATTYDCRHGAITYDCRHGATTPCLPH